MIVNHRLIYMQMPKTACSHISAMLQAHANARPHGPKHGRLTFDPGEKLVFGSVRNPWSWYVSLWAYGCRPAGDLQRRLTRPLPRRWSRSRRLLTQAPRRALQRLHPVPADLRRDPKLWAELYGDVEDVHLFRRWLRAVLEPPTRHQLPEDYSDSGLARCAGLMTYRFVRLNSHWQEWDKRHARIRTLPELRNFWQDHSAIQHCIRQEYLESDLAEVMNNAGYSVGPKALSTGKRTNSSHHRDWRDYYDIDTAAIVADRDALIMESYGYESPV